MPRGHLRAVAAGTGVALAVALPAALVAQVLDARTDEGLATGWLAALTLVVLAGVALGGWVAGRVDGRRPAVTAALAGLAAITVVQAVSVLRLAVAGEDVEWASVPAVMVVGTGLAVLAGALSARHRRRRRSQPLL